ncbi:MAG: hypothetical protein ACQEVA_09555, partial [Myxococcota bacterium]
DREQLGDGVFAVFERPPGGDPDAPAEDSWIAEASRCRAAFEEYETLANMPLETRKMVTGIAGDASKYFGGMGASIQFKQLLRDDFSELDTSLKMVIPLDRHRRISPAALEDYIFATTELFGAGVTAAARLAGMKRPDSILPVNSANRASLDHCFGEKARTINSFVQLHEQIWDLEWFDAPEPEDELERLVWQNRVALLDVFFYDPSDR